MADILGIDHQVMRKMLFDYKSVVKEIPLTINDKELLSVLKSILGGIGAIIPK